MGEMNCRKALFGVALVFAALVYTVPAAAQSSLLTYNYVEFYYLPDDPTTLACSTSVSDCSGSVLAPNTNWTVNYLSKSSAAFGVFHSYASFFLTGDDSLGPLNGGSVPFPYLLSVGGRAGFRDKFTLGGGTGAGTISLTFSVTGASSQTFGSFGRAVFQNVPMVNGLEDWHNAVQYPVAPDGTATVSVPFTFNQPFQLEIWFYALAQIVSPFGWRSGATATADYSHTATLTEITVKDSTGATVPSFTITAQSGTRYDDAGVFSPVSIRVKPGDVVPAINSQSKGATAVAVLSTPDFDAFTGVDRVTLTFGSTGFEHSLLGCSNSAEDVNYDGRPDLVCTFATESTGFAVGDSVGQLRGRTVGGVALRGSDVVRVIR